MLSLLPSPLAAPSSCALCVGAAQGVKSQAVEDRFAASDAGGGADAGEATAPSFPTQAALKTMDPKAVRRLLVSLGLPGAGTPQKLVARAVAIAQAVEAGQGLQAGLEAARRLR